MSICTFAVESTFPETSSGIGIQINWISVCFVMLRSFTNLMVMAQIIDRKVLYIYATLSTLDTATFALPLTGFP